jgi:hypothetical protein
MHAFPEWGTARKHKAASSRRTPRCPDGHLLTHDRWMAPRARVAGLALPAPCPLPSVRRPQKCDSSPYGERPDAVFGTWQAWHGPSAYGVDPAAAAESVDVSLLRPSPPGGHSFFTSPHLVGHHALPCRANSSAGSGLRARSGRTGPTGLPPSHLSAVVADRRTVSSSRPAPRPPLPGAYADSNLLLQSQHVTAKMQSARKYSMSPPGRPKPIPQRRCPRLRVCKL